VAIVAHMDRYDNTAQLRMVPRHRPQPFLGIHTGDKKLHQPKTPDPLFFDKAGRQVLCLQKDWEEQGLPEDQTSKRSS